MFIVDLFKESSLSKSVSLNLFVFSFKLSYLILLNFASSLFDFYIKKCNTEPIKSFLNILICSRNDFLNFEKYIFNFIYQKPFHYETAFDKWSYRARVMTAVLNNIKTSQNFLKKIGFDKGLFEAFFKKITYCEGHNNTINLNLLLATVTIIRLWEASLRWPYTNCTNLGLLFTQKHAMVGLLCKNMAQLYFTLKLLQKFFVIIVLFLFLTIWLIFLTTNFHEKVETLRFLEITETIFSAMLKKFRTLFFGKPRGF